MRESERRGKEGDLVQKEAKLSIHEQRERERERKKIQYFPLFLSLLFLRFFTSTSLRPPREIRDGVTEGEFKRAFWCIVVV